MGSQQENEDIKQRWKSEQNELKTQLITEDVVMWFGKDSDDDEAKLQMKFIGGVDLSFVKGDDKHACAALVVLTYPELEVVYENHDFVHLSAPYLPEFLAFREVSFLSDLISKLRKDHAHLEPKVVLVDGNGILHPRGFGLASHLGVISNVCTVGVGKTLFHVDGLEKDSGHLEKISELQKAGDHFLLVGNSGSTLGAALRSTDASRNPIYVSVGHKISLESALKICTLCAKHRIPEPIRQADVRSREFLRRNYNDLVKKCCGQGSGRPTSTEDSQ